MTFDALEHLKESSTVKDDDLQPAITAIALSVPNAKGLSVDRYLNHLEKLGQDVAARFRALVEEGSGDDANTRLAALKHVLSDKHGYEGDYDEDNIDNAVLSRVIDRRRGLPISLALLYVHAARAQGWDIDGLSLPGYFLCRLEHDGVRHIFDPSDQCRILDAPDLRAIVKSARGENAELSASYYEPVGNRDWLIEMQNIVKLKQIELSEYRDALRTVEHMRLLDPFEFRLLLDAGVLYAKTGKTSDAVEALENYIEESPNHKDRQDAALLLQQIKEDMHRV